MDKERLMKRHRFNPISAVFGLLFAILGFRFLTGRIMLAAVDLNWLWPLAAVALGLALLFTARRTDVPESADIQANEGATPVKGPEG